jgi:hypothetical protein
MVANMSECAFGGHPLCLPFSATAMVGCSMNIRLPHRDGTMVNGELPLFQRRSGPKGALAKGGKGHSERRKSLSVHRTKLIRLAKRSLRDSPDHIRMWWLLCTALIL